MKTLEQTAERLVLAERSRRVSLAVAVVASTMVVMAWFALRDAPAISLGLVVIGLMLGAVASLSYWDESVEFCRNRGQVVIRSSHPLRRAPKSIPLHELREAVPQTRPGNASEIGYKGHRATRPVLVRRGSATPIPLTPAYADPEETRIIVQVINDWLGVGRSRRTSR